MRLILATVLALIAGVAQLFAEQVTVGFSDLADPEARAFDDPYLAMGPERLEDLKAVVRIDERLASRDLASDTRQRLEARRDAARQSLTGSGFDIDKLLAQRWMVAEKRRRALIATNPALEGAEVEIGGYLIPAEASAGGRAIGYLVPVVGMCSHMPAPPPNELVRVHFDPAMMTESMYLPIRVFGTLRTEANDETIHLLDGKVRMVSLWRLDALRVVMVATPRFTSATSAPRDHPLWTSNMSNADASLN